ncbi:hypothetical protein [Parasphingopyxis lamellibrachiae]|uniref:ElaB/YqjD/DUF883 family membrane-anchored ribosome-binding protein n=1 Tax=Parasphingopyxis lamellibrachiae TaxID=680125 RepID=A0A3D9FCL4_9SPHN|nr:hypothetical protein [Parasphingopyxis lamellibrachiae]RED15539.1 hypothetical protein DFR46_0534 [Parasphingopyxis lamellibrachiae]
MAAKKKDASEAVGAAVETLAEEAELSTVAKAKERIRDEATNLRTQATEHARDYATQGKDKATGAIKDVSAAMDDAAKSVDERLGENYGEYARKAAGAVASLADKIEGKEVDDMLRDAEAFVRRSPVIAIGIAAVAGFAIARLVKSGLGERDDA